MKKEVLKITIPESDFPVAYHGEYHYRTGSTKQQLTGFALTQFLFHKMHLAWDSAETASKDIVLNCSSYVTRRGLVGNLRARGLSRQVLELKPEC